ncbi:transcriptional regulator [Aeromonas rivipollensis]|uniref:OmpR/PhoB-type domain-containing protein n=1 Tax=Aeromonas rivipollensis TaxID=948519 RepID=A0AAW9YA93_9GAMM|nr:winged helix-turn-helix domain-containing protein [Aeromonas rivipollensis]NEX73596.1 hypothetical protein [Aeromonas rivipollensis]
MWRLYCSTGEIKYNDELVHRLSHSETIVLSLLISHHGQLVMKDTLLDLGWPNKIVAPNSLTTAIKGIRKVIKVVDSDVYIETVYRRGYILHQNNNIEIVMEDVTPLPERSESVSTVDDVISVQPTPLEHSALTHTNENESELFPISDKSNRDTLSTFWGGGG